MFPNLIPPHPGRFLLSFMVLAQRSVRQLPLANHLRQEGRIPKLIGFALVN